MSEGRYVVDVGGERRRVAVAPCGARWELVLDGETHLVEQAVLERDEVVHLLVDGRSYLVDLVEKDWKRGRFVINFFADQIEVRVRDELEAVAEEITGGRGGEESFELKAPMPGIVVRALVAPGETVARGQGLMILEAMKMQNELASELDGVVQEILVEDGQMVDGGTVLARVVRAEPPAGD